MKDTFSVTNGIDENGNPTGGTYIGTGMRIDWQNGPLGRGDDRKKPNGAFVETVLAAALERLRFYQTSKFNCEANALAMTNIEAALDILDARTKERESRQVEGTHAT